MMIVGNLISALMYVLQYSKGLYTSIYLVYTISQNIIVCTFNEVTNIFFIALD